MTSASNTPSVLMIVTSHDQLGTTGETTGFWFEELAAPYVEFASAGLQVDIASPRGGRGPVDPRSLAEPSEAVDRFKADPQAVDKLENTLVLSDVRRAYDAYFVVGGHGVMWDLADHRLLQSLLAEAFEDGRIVSAVCHLPAALVNVRLAGGEPLVKGRRVTGFTNEEERAVGLDEVVPFLIETAMEERGARFEKGPAWAPFTVTDGRLITGQNPASSAPAARDVLAALRVPAGTVRAGR
jgi:putative intracellular protease/amidase